MSTWIDDEQAGRSYHCVLEGFENVDGWQKVLVLAPQCVRIDCTVADGDSPPIMIIICNNNKIIILIDELCM